MKKQTILSVICGVIVLLVGFIAFSMVHPEQFLHKPKTWTATQVAQMPLDSKGQLAGFDVPYIESATQFSEDVLYSADKMTVKALSVTPTNVYELKPWTSRTRTVGRKRHKRTVQKDFVVTSPFQNEVSYNRYYILELPDHSHILAKIPPHFVSAAKKGKPLPIGEKTAVSPAAQSALSKYNTQYHFPIDCVYDCFDAKWYEQNDIFVIAIKAVFALIPSGIIGFLLYKITKKIC